MNLSGLWGQTDTSRDAFHAFASENPEGYKHGFPWHPHRGIETITRPMERAARIS